MKRGRHVSKFLESEKPKTADPAVLRVRNAFCLALGERLLEEDEEVVAFRLLEEDEEVLPFRLLEEDEWLSMSAAEVDELVTKRRGATVPHNATYI